MIGLDIYNNLKLKPYVLILNISRKYIDVNREINKGCENIISEEIYKKYYNKILEIKNKILEKYNDCILIDIHGFKSDKIEIQLGDNKIYSKVLLGFSKIISENGISCFPNDKLKHNKYYSGGNIVKKFRGIQMEISSKIRLNYDKYRDILIKSILDLQVC